MLQNSEVQAFAKASQGLSVATPRACLFRCIACAMRTVRHVHRRQKTMATIAEGRPRTRGHSTSRMAPCPRHQVTGIHSEFLLATWYRSGVIEANRELDPMVGQGSPGLILHHEFHHLRPFHGHVESQTRPKHPQESTPGSSVVASSTSKATPKQETGSRSAPTKAARWDGGTMPLKRASPFAC